MSNNAKTLIEQARALPPQGRIALVEDMLDSLDSADPGIDQMWARQASDRLAAYRRGELAAKDLSDGLIYTINNSDIVVLAVSRRHRRRTRLP